MSNFRDVCVFNRSFGLPHSDTPQTNILQENRKLSKLRVDLCVEEAEELSDAFKTHNFIEIIDALTDELYVAYGVGSSFGVNLDYLFRYKVFNQLYRSQHPEGEDLDILTYEKNIKECSSLDTDIITMTNYNLLRYILVKTEPFFTENRVSTINSDNIFGDIFKTKDYENVRILLDDLHNNIKMSIKQLEINKNISSFNGVVGVLVDLLCCLGGNIDPVDPPTEHIGDQQMRAGKIQGDPVGTALDVGRIVHIASLNHLAKRPARPVGIHQAQARCLIGDDQASIGKGHAILWPVQRLVGWKELGVLKGPVGQDGCFRSVATATRKGDNRA